MAEDLGLFSVEVSEDVELPGEAGTSIPSASEFEIIRRGSNMVQQYVHYSAADHTQVGRILAGEIKRHYS